MIVAAMTTTTLASSKVQGIPSPPESTFAGRNDSMVLFLGRERGSRTGYNTVASAVRAARFLSATDHSDAALAVYADLSAAAGSRYHLANVMRWEYDPGLGNEIRGEAGLSPGDVEGGVAYPRLAWSDTVNHRHVSAVVDGDVYGYAPKS